MVIQDYHRHPGDWLYSSLGDVAAKVTVNFSGVSTSQTLTSKITEELAQEVIADKWGNGQDRKDRLTAAGYDCATVQAKVNELIRKPSSTKTVYEFATEVIQGNWGNGEERKQRLTASGYDYAAIQKRVNELMWK